MKYRRVRVEGGCYFFTVALADRKSDLLVANIAALRAAVKTVKHVGWAKCRLGSNAQHVISIINKTGTMSFKNTELLF